MARRYVRVNVLHLLRTDPKIIDKWHPTRFRELKDTGMTLQERRALYCHLEALGQSWGVMAKKDENAEQKWTWFQNIRKTLKREIDKEEKKMPRRDAVKYEADLGFPEGPEYFQMSVIKATDPSKDSGKPASVTDAVFEAKRAEWKSELQKHHRNLVATSEAERCLLQIADILEKLETEEVKWILSTPPSSPSVDKKVLQSSFLSSLSELRKVVELSCSRSGINTTGKRNPLTDAEDKRSLLEIGFSEELTEWSTEYCQLIALMMSSHGIADTQISSALRQVETFAEDLHKKNGDSLSARQASKPEAMRQLKPRIVRAKRIRDQAKQQAASASSSSSSSGPSTGEQRSDSPAPPSLSKEIKNRPVNPLLQAIKQRAKKEGGESDNNASDKESSSSADDGGGVQRRNGFASSQNGQAALMAAIKKRSAMQAPGPEVEGGDNKAGARPNPNNLLAAIRARKVE